MHTIHYACHVAHIDPLTGEGLLVMPRVSDDMGSPSLGGSLHASAWDAVVRDLAAIGWEPSEGDEGLAVEAGTTTDGRAVVGLYGLDPIHAEPSLDLLAASSARLRKLAGVA